jgi:glycosyltransferase involved in cell wall biosynthesis
LIPEKGFFDLLQIWKSVVDKNPQARLAIAGITEQQSYVECFLEKVVYLGLSENICFLGELPEDQLRRVIVGSTLCCSQVL